MQIVSQNLRGKNIEVPTYKATFTLVKFSAITPVTATRDYLPMGGATEKSFLFFVMSPKVAKSSK
jgi:hypothetical protein